MLDPEDSPPCRHQLEGWESRFFVGDPDPLICFFCVNQEAYQFAYQNNRWRHLPGLTGDCRQRRWWGEICRDRVLGRLWAYVAELESQRVRAQREEYRHWAVVSPQQHRELNAAAVERLPRRPTTDEEGDHYRDTLYLGLERLQDTLERTYTARSMITEMEKEMDDADFWIARAAWPPLEVLMNWIDQFNSEWVWP